MILVHLLLFLVVLVVLILQLITPLVLNIPLIAFSLLILIFTLWSFRRARRNKKVPIVAGAAVGLQSLLFLLSIAILVVVTIPHESAEDSPAVVQGIRRFLVSQGLLEKPKAVAPAGAAATLERKAPETLNAPDVAKIQIKIEDDPKEKPAAAAAPANTTEKNPKP